MLTLMGATGAILLALFGDAFDAVGPRRVTLFALASRGARTTAGFMVIVYREDSDCKDGGREDGDREDGDREDSDYADSDREDSHWITKSSTKLCDDDDVDDDNDNDNDGDDMTMTTVVTTTK